MEDDDTATSRQPLRVVENRRYSFTTLHADRKRTGLHQARDQEDNRCPGAASCSCSPVKARTITRWGEAFSITARHSGASCCSWTRLQSRCWVDRWSIFFTMTAERKTTHSPTSHRAARPFSWSSTRWPEP